MRAREAPRPTFYGQTILKKALETAKRFCYKNAFNIEKLSKNVSRIIQLIADLLIFRFAAEKPNMKKVL